MRVSDLPGCNTRPSSVVPALSRAIFVLLVPGYRLLRTAVRSFPPFDPLFVVNIHLMKADNGSQFPLGLKNVDNLDRGITTTHTETFNTQGREASSKMTLGIS